MGSLRGVHLRVCSSPLKNAISIGEVHNETVFTEDGYYSKLFLVLQEFLHFSYELRIVKGFGTKLTNGTWTGKVAAIQKNECDMAVILAFTYERTEVIDYSEIVANFKGIFFIKNSDEISKIYAILYPFSLNVWIATSFAFAVGVISFHLLLKFDSRMSKRKIPTLFTILWAFFGSFAAKGHRLFNRHGSSRWIAIGWLIAFFLLTSSYGGALMSFITFPGYEHVPRTFKELADALEKGQYIASTLQGSALIVHINEGNEGTLLKMKKMAEEGRIIETQLDDVLVSKLVTEKHALIYYDVTGTVLLGSKFKDFVTSVDHLLSHYVAFGIRKDFPFKKEFNLRVRRCTEAGLMNQFIKDGMRRSGVEKKGLEGKEAKPFQIYDIIGALALLIIGYFVSCIVFIFELIIGKIKNITKSDSIEFEYY